jgi:hypothetical protein
MTGELSRLSPAPARRAEDLPPGPVVLWLAVVSSQGQLMGAAAVPGPLLPCWRDGKLHVSYPPVHAAIEAAGRYDRAYIIAVSGRAWRPVARITLGPPRELRPGDSITVTDGTLSLDFAGGPSDPWLS